MKFTELVDINELQKLCESFTAFTRIGTAITDTEGNILTSAGWQDICTKFHRVNPETALRCRESDTTLSEQINEGARFKIYMCKNGLIDVAFPIVIRNEHLASFFIGQFFFKEPDRKFFIRQAEEFHFDKKSYLEALDKVPVYSEIYIMKMIEFLGHFVRVIGESGLARKGVEAMREQLILELNDSTKQIKILSGLLPICTSCKKIRIDNDQWEEIEEYVRDRTDADFSHSLCPSCTKRLYPEFYKKIEK